MKERFCRSDELKYLLLGERGCQVPSDFIVFRIFNFHFLYLYSYFFFEMRGTQVPCGIFFPFVSSLSLPPSLSPSLQTEQIFTKRRQKRIFRHLKIWIILKQETQIFAPHYILLFIHKRLSFNSPFCQGQIKDQIWIVIQHVFFLLKEKQQWEFPDKQSSFKIFPAFSENISS